MEIMVRCVLLFALMVCMGIETLLKWHPHAGAGLRSNAQGPKHSSSGGRFKQPEIQVWQVKFDLGLETFWVIDLDARAAVNVLFVSYHNPPCPQTQHHVTHPKRCYPESYQSSRVKQASNPSIAWVLWRLTSKTI